MPVGALSQLGSTLYLRMGEGHGWPLALLLTWSDLWRMRMGNGRFPVLLGLWKAYRWVIRVTWGSVFDPIHGSSQVM